MRSLLDLLRDLVHAFLAAAAELADDRRRPRLCPGCDGWGEGVDRGTLTVVACPTCHPDAYGGPDD